MNDKQQNFYKRLLINIRVKCLKQGIKKSEFCLKQGRKISDICLKQGQGMRGRAAPHYRGIYRLSPRGWNCDEFYIGKTKRRLHDRKTEHFKALSKSDHTSAIADHIITAGHDIKWDHFDILVSGKTDSHLKIKETLFIQELKPSLNVNISSEKLLLF